MNIIQKAEQYVSNFLETNKDVWFAELLGKEKEYRHWGVAAVKGLFNWQELETIAVPVAGCFALIKDSEGREWAGVVTEVLEDQTVRVIEFGTTPNYNLQGSEFGYGVYRKRRSVSAYAEFCEVVKTEQSKVKNGGLKKTEEIRIPATLITNVDIEEIESTKDGVGWEFKITPHESVTVEINDKVSTDLPQSQSLAVEDQQQSVEV